MGMPYGVVVTILRPSATEPTRYGDDPAATITRIDVTRCGVAPRMSTEPTIRGRQGVIVGLSLYAPAGTVILSTDKVEINGGGTVSGAPVHPDLAEVYEVEGQPGAWANPLTGTVFGVEVALKKGLG